MKKNKIIIKFLISIICLFVTFFMFDITSYANNMNPIALTKVNTITALGNDYVKIDDKIYFSARSSLYGQELWVTDDTRVGTKILKNINTGSSSSNPENIVNIGDEILFTATDSSHGKELWKSDGTEDGTVLVKDITSGSTSTLFWSFYAEYDDEYYFEVLDSSNNYELWKSDGTEDGTVIVDEFDDLGSITEYNGYLYYEAKTLDGQYGFWRTDGTEVGTEKIFDYSEDSYITQYKIIDDNMYIVLAPLEYDQDDLYLWMINDTTSTFLGTFNAVNQSNFQNVINLSPAVSMDDYIYFTAGTTVTGLELWRSDGTEAGTQIVKDINSGAAQSVEIDNSFYMEKIGNYIYLTATDGTTGSELWRSDGTESGTQIVRDIYSGSSSSNPRKYAVLDNELYFVADNGTNGRELWKTNGTEVGTQIVSDIYTGSNSSNPDELSVVNEELYFTANAGSNGEEFYRINEDSELEKLSSFSDGSSTNLIIKLIDKDLIYFGKFYGAGKADFYYYNTLLEPHFIDDDPAIVIEDFSDLYPSEISIMEVVNLNDKTYFTGYDQDDELHLWEGNDSENTLFESIMSPDNLMATNEAFYFYAADDEHGYEIWTSNGTEAGTHFLKDVYEGMGSSYSGDPKFTANGSRVFFVASTDSTFGQLWTTDGTESGTVQLTNLENYDTVENIFVFKDVTYFTTGSYELWRTNGTEEGTILIGELNLSWNTEFAITDDWIYFNGSDGSLWTTDGTIENTQIVKTFQPFTMENLTVINDNIYFSATDEYENGQELWMSDGTESGTVMVKDIFPVMYSSSSPSELVNVDGILYFTAVSGDEETDTGVELWMSDGTEAGTVMIKDITLGPNTDGPFNLKNINETLYFSYKNDSEVQLWTSDGTESGTVQITNFQYVDYPELDVTFEDLLNIDDRIYFNLNIENTFNLSTETYSYYFVTQDSETEVQTFTVTFKDYDGTILKTEEVNSKEAATAPSNPQRTGYTFTNWDKSFNEVTDDLIVTAVYSKNTYKVEFKDYDGTVLKTQYVQYQEAATAPNNPSRAGYIFDGWDKNYNSIANITVVTATYKSVVTTEEKPDSQDTTDDQNDNQEDDTNEPEIVINEIKDELTEEELEIINAAVDDYDDEKELIGVYEVEIPENDYTLPIEINLALNEYQQEFSDIEPLELKTDNTIVNVDYNRVYNNLKFNISDVLSKYILIGSLTAENTGSAETNSMTAILIIAGILLLATAVIVVFIKYRKRLN